MKPPFHVLYSNDTTHIDTCRSPYAPESFDQTSQIGKPFTADRLRASVDETAGRGVDAHFLQPGVGWVPWWKSDIYPFGEHVRFMKERTGMDPSASGFAQFMAEGGDIVGDFVDRCRKKDLAPFVSFRLNDSHGHEFVGMDPEEIPGWAWHVFSPVHVNHPEWRLGQDLNDWEGRVLNWAIPEVRAHKFAFIKEIIDRYDLDGFELDFMRHFNFFHLEETTREERNGIMSAFVADVRDALDACPHEKRRRWLCVRVPAFLAVQDTLGVDLPGMCAAGVDMINLSHSYFTEQAADFDAIRASVADASIYLEMTHCIHQVRPPLDTRRRVYDCTIQRKTTPHQFQTTAHLAYAHGLDGVSLFNFPYYREHGWGERGPSSEPPFEALEHLGDPAWLARQPHHYFQTRGWDRKQMVPTPLPRAIDPGESAEFIFDLAPPDSGWTNDARLRIQADGSLEQTEWSAVFNDLALQTSNDRSEPFNNPYPQLLGESEEFCAWVLPAKAMRPGENRLEVTLYKGAAPVNLTYADIIVP